MRMVPDVTWNDTTVDYPASATLHGLFEAQAARTPDAVAVRDAGRSYTYAELDTRASQVAHRLRRYGVVADSVVGICVDRSFDLVAGLFGILKAGGAYLPLDPEHPSQRTAYMLADAGAAVLLTQEHLRPADPAWSGPPVLVLNEPADWREERLASLPPAAGPDNLCSLYYTSGSTGRPKAVASTHTGWVNRMHWMQREHPLGIGETVLHKTTLIFDDSAVEIFWPLAVGATVAMLEPGLHRDAEAILDEVLATGAVHVQFVPSMLELFLDAIDEHGSPDLSRLRSVLSSGEALRPRLVERFFQLTGGHVRLDNTWGATEVSIDSTCHVCRPADAADTAPAVSLGRPIDNNQVYVLDEVLAEQPVGVPGELYIGGVGLARGYHGRAGLTADRFRPDPFGAPGTRLYRTGDRGCRASDGTLRFLGRVDHQVKVRGVRIELEEIEAVLRRQPGVSDAVVVARATDQGGSMLVGYVMGDALPARLRAGLKNILPAVMVPQRFVCLDSFPLNDNGKVDRRQLPAPAART